jgi:hypothetical protein
MDMDTWKHGPRETWKHGDMDMETWTWGRGHGDVDMETWKCRRGHGDMDIKTWTCRHGHGVTELKYWGILRFLGKKSTGKRKTEAWAISLIHLPFAHHSNGSLLFVRLLTGTWRQDMKIETRTWRHGHGDTDMETLTWRNSHMAQRTLSVYCLLTV